MLCPNWPPLQPHGDLTWATMSLQTRGPKPVCSNISSVTGKILEEGHCPTVTNGVGHGWGRQLGGAGAGGTHEALGSGRHQTLPCLPEEEGGTWTSLGEVTGWPLDPPRGEFLRQERLWKRTGRADCSKQELGVGSRTEQAPWALLPPLLSGSSGWS